MVSNKKEQSEQTPDPKLDTCIYDVLYDEELFSKKCSVSNYEIPIKSQSLPAKTSQTDNIYNVPEGSDVFWKENKNGCTVPTYAIPMKLNSTKSVMEKNPVGPNNIFEGHHTNKDRKITNESEKIEPANYEVPEH